MTEKQKKMLIIAGTVIIGLLLLLMSKRQNKTVSTNSVMPGINVSVPGFTMPPREPIAINIPGLPSGSTYEFQAISPCMCNGQTTVPVNSELTFASAPPPISSDYTYVQPISGGTGFGSATTGGIRGFISNYLVLN